MIYRWINNLPLRVKLIMPIWLLLTTGIVVVGIAVTHIVSENIEKSLIGRTEIMANVVASNLTAALAFDDKASGNEQLQALGFDPDLIAARVSRPDNSEFVALLRLPDDCHVFGRAFICSNTSISQVTRSITLGNDVLGNIDIFISRKSINDERRRLVRLLILGATVLSLLSWIFAHYLHRIVSYPLASLHQSMSTMIRLGVQRNSIPIRHNDELGQLTACFNDMVTSLAERDGQLNATFKQLEDKNRYIHQVLDTMDRGVMVIAPGDIVTYYNPAAERHIMGLGCDPKELNQLLHVLEPVSLMYQISEAVDAHLPLSGIELRHRYTERLFKVSTHPMATATHSLVQFEDITAHNLAEQRRKMAELIFDQSQDATLVLSRKLDIEAQNAACTRTFGAQLQWAALTLDPHLRLTREEMKTLLVKGNYKWHTQLISAKGISLPCKITVRTLTNRQGKLDAFVVSIVDQTDVLELKRLNYIAHHDQLTGLANREKAQKRLVRKHNFGFGVYVLFVDLDGFKKVNDQYGHHIGDELLKVVARRLEASVAKTDLVARLSGDEFLLIISDTLLIDSIAERVLRKLNEPISISGVIPRISASIGIRYWSAEDHTLLSTVIEQADKAMYCAKSAGKNGYAFASLDEKVDEKVMIGC